MTNNSWKVEWNWDKNGGTIAGQTKMHLVNYKNIYNIVRKPKSIIILMKLDNLPMKKSSELKDELL